MIGTSLTLGQWSGASKVKTESLKCGFCSEGIASEKGYICAHPGNSHQYAALYICPKCNGPTLVTVTGLQVPGSPIGRKIEHLPKEVLPLFDEAKRCFQINAFTSSVLCCRIIIMHVAVEKGADTNKQFAFYVDYLKSEGYIPKGNEEAIKKIKDKGNEANHEIKVVTKQEAEETLYFLETLLLIIYELPVKSGAQATSGP